MNATAIIDDLDIGQQYACLTVVRINPIIYRIITLPIQCTRIDRPGIDRTPNPILIPCFRIIEMENGSEGINECLPLAEHHFDFFRGRIVGYHKVVAFFVRLRSAIRRGLSTAGLCDSGINFLWTRAVPGPSRQFVWLDSDTAMGTRGSATDGVVASIIQHG